MDVMEAAAQAEAEDREEEAREAERAGDKMEPAAATADDNDGDR